MPTLADFARQYATSIRNGARLEKRASLTESVRRDSLSREVRTVLDAIDGMTVGGAPIDERTRDNLYAAIERELGVGTGDFRQLKEASISSAISYELYVSMLLQALERQ
jgi:hypothetical protein